MAVGPGPSYGSSEAGVLLNILIMSCDKPIGLFGDGLVDLADCGPVRDDADVLGTTFGKKLSDVSTIGENLIFVCLPLHI